MHLNRLYTPLLAILVTACSGADGDGNARGHLWTEETAWVLREDLRLGTVGENASDWEQFGGIAAIAADSEGRIYVLDELAQEIQVFLPDGRFSHTIGREGQGPAEFSGARAVVIGPGDTLTVVDDGNMRFSVFLGDGTLVRNHRREIVGYGQPLQARLLDGSFVDWSIAFPDGRPAERVFYHPVRYSPDFAVADTFPPIRHRNPMVEDGSLPLLDFGGFVAAAPDAGGGIWFAHSREYRIFRRELEGDTVLTFGLPATPPPLGEPERAYVRDRWADRPEIRTGQLEALPEHRSVVHGVFPDNDGHVYVIADLASEPPGTIVDVFTEDGTYMGRMHPPVTIPLTPNRPPVVLATPDALYVVVKDELDVQYVSRLAIMK